MLVLLYNYGAPTGHLGLKCISLTLTFAKSFGRVVADRYIEVAGEVADVRKRIGIFRTSWGVPSGGYS